MIYKKLFFLFAVFTVHGLITAQYNTINFVVDSVFESMSLDQKIATIIVDNNSILRNGEVHVVSKSIYPSFGHIKGEIETNKWGSVNWVCENVYAKHDSISQTVIKSALASNNSKSLLRYIIKMAQSQSLGGLWLDADEDCANVFRYAISSSADAQKLAKAYLVTWRSNDYSMDSIWSVGVFDTPKHILDKKEFLSYTDSEMGKRNPVLQSTSEKQDELRELAKKSLSLEYILNNGGLVQTDKWGKTFSFLRRAFHGRNLPEELLEQSCKNSLRLEFLKGLSKPIQEENRINENIKALGLETILSSITLLKNEEDLIPIKGLDTTKIATLHVGESQKSVFQSMLNNYFEMPSFQISSLKNINEFQKIFTRLKEFDVIIVGINEPELKQQLGISSYQLLSQLGLYTKTIITLFGEGETLRNIPSNHRFSAVLLGQQNSATAQSFSAQILFGGLAAKGKIQQDLNAEFLNGKGIITEANRLGYRKDFTQDFYSDTLLLIDQVVNEALQVKATPGCQILVAKNGKVILNKSYGSHTYAAKRKVKNTDLYDIASLTKIIATVPVLMQMYQEGKYELDDSISVLLPELATTNKSGMRVSDMLVHQAGLPAWIPFYLGSIDTTELDGDIFDRRYSKMFNLQLDKNLYMNRTVKYRDDLYHHSQSSSHGVRVAQKTYLLSSYVDSMYHTIDTVKIDSVPEYLYSDLGYYYFKRFIEKVEESTLDEIVENRFYKSLGASRLTYHPLNKFSKYQITPTEDDIAFRKELVHGYVHDPGAIMMGGVGGHAGLFSNANDLAKMAQMFLNRGSYGGIDYIDKDVIDVFTTRGKEDNRRGLGFDKPVIDPELSGPSCSEASSLSYGHSGFTGTLIWMDPKYNLIYVFLSNRIHPSQYNKELIKRDIRTRIQSIVYRSMKDYWKDMEQEGEVL